MVGARCDGVPIHHQPYTDLYNLGKPDGQFRQKHAFWDLCSRQYPGLFSSTGGTVNPSKGSTQNGVSKTTFTPSSTGTASVTASVDGQSMTAPVTVISGGLPEFPSPVIPAILIIGLLGTVLFIRRIREY